jgi:hypothetical protein
LIDFRRGRIQRFEAWRTEQSESTIVEESDGNIGSIVVVKFEGLIDNGGG